MASNKRGEEQEASSKHGKNALEWTIFASSVLLVGGVMAFLVRETLTTTSLPARLEVSLGEPVKAQERMLVPVTVQNKGEVTAASVEVEVKRRSGETANFSLPHVPREASRKGWVVFDAPLDKKELKAQILGYEEP